MGFIKIKTCLLRATIKKMKKQATDLEKIFAKKYLTKKLYQEYIKKSYDSIISHITPFQKRAKDLNRHFTHTYKKNTDSKQHMKKMFNIIGHYREIQTKNTISYHQTFTIKLKLRLKIVSIVENLQQLNFNILLVRIKNTGHF